MKENRENQCSPEGRGGGRAGFGKEWGKGVKPPTWKVLEGPEDLSSDAVE